MPFAVWPAVRLLTQPTTYNQAAYLHSNGSISTSVYRWYCFFWTWSAPRFSDVENASQKQYRYSEKWGYPALERRFARVQRLQAKVTAKMFAPYLAANPTNPTKDEAIHRQENVN